MRTATGLLMLTLLGIGLWGTRPATKPAGPVPENTFQFEAVDGSIVTLDLAPPTDPAITPSHFP